MATWDKEEAKVATEAAEKDFDEMFKAMSEEEKQAVRKLAAWWRRWYNGSDQYHATGHKALARHIVNNVSNPK